MHRERPGVLEKHEWKPLVQTHSVKRASDLWASNKEYLDSGKTKWEKQSGKIIRVKKRGKGKVGTGSKGRVEVKGQEVKGSKRPGVLALESGCECWWTKTSLLEPRGITHPKGLGSQVPWLLNQKSLWFWFHKKRTWDFAVWGHVPLERG